MMNDEKLQELAEMLTELDRQEMATINRIEEATTYTAESLKDPETMQYIIEWLLNYV